MNITKGVVPAAGKGVRMLPATKSQPKEMLPVLNKPIIQYVVEELDKSGIDNLLVITGRSKRAIEDHFDTDHQLAEILSENGKKKLLDQVELIHKLRIKLFYTRQSKPTGLADAVYLAREFIDDEDFVVALGDEFLLSDFTKKLIQIHEKQESAATFAVEKIDKNAVEKYGVIKGKQVSDGIYRVDDLIEKPKIQNAPSNLRIASRYVFSPKIFEAIKKTPVGIGKERQLTDAIRLLVKEDLPVYAVEIKPPHKIYNTGDPLGYYNTLLELMLVNKEYGQTLRKNAEQILKKQSA